MFKAYADTDHVTEATGKTIAITISKNGAAFGNPNAGATNATEVSSGWYKVTLDTTDTGTVGPLAVRGTNADIDDIGVLYYVVKATNGGWTALPDTAVTTNASLITSGTGTAQLSVSGGKTLLQDGAVTAAVIATDAIDADAVADGAITSGVFASGAITADAIAANAIGSSEIADGAITAAKFAAGAITATVIATDAIDDDALSADAIAAINATVDTALADYDGPTHAELVSEVNSVQTDIAGVQTSVDDLPTNAELATALGTADDAVLAAVAAVDGKVDTVDSVVDSIKAKTDSLTFTVAGQADVNIQYVNDVQVSGAGAPGDEWGPT